MVFSNFPWIPRHTVAAALLAVSFLCSQPFSTCPQPPAERPVLSQEATESYGGVGLVLWAAGDQLTVIRPLEGSPAQAAGLQPGDVIKGVDGRDCSQLSPNQAVKRMRGEAGSWVQLEVYRPAGQERLKMVLQRATIHVPAEFR